MLTAEAIIFALNVIFVAQAKLHSRMGIDGENCNWFQDLVVMVWVGRWSVHFGWAESISGIGPTD